MLAMEGVVIDTAAAAHSWKRPDGLQTHYVAVQGGATSVRSDEWKRQRMEENTESCQRYLSCAGRRVRKRSEGGAGEGQRESEQDALSCLSHLRCDSPNVEARRPTWLLCAVHRSVIRKR